MAGAVAAWRVVQVTAGVVSVSEHPRPVCVKRLKHLRTLLSPQVRNRVTPIPRPPGFPKEKKWGNKFIMLSAYCVQKIVKDLSVGDVNC